MMQRSRFLVRGTLLLIMGFLLASASGADEAFNLLAVYENQVPAWEACDASTLSDDYKGLLTLFGERTRRATIKVPLDYADPARGDIEVALLKVAAGDPQRRRGAILINPGGPGDDGLPYSLLFGYLWGEANPATNSESGKLFREIAQCYDLVGFSPRGTGSSTRLRCTSAEKLMPASILVADDAAENIQNNLLNARMKAEACLSNPLTPYINSDATARDMDIIRRVLGDDKLNYLGISYGTWLGTWYAGLFPERAGRMVMIGNTDITTPLNDTLLSQEMGMQRVMDEILAPYAAENSEVFRLGGSAEEVRQVFRSLQGNLLDVTSALLHETIAQSVNAHVTLFTFYAAKTVQDLLGAYSPETEESLNALLEKNEWGIPPEFRDLALERAKTISTNYFQKLRMETGTVDMDSFDAVGWAVQCNDAGTSYDADAWVEASAFNAERYPLFGGSDIENPCLYWGGQSVKRPPVETIARAGGFVMLQSEYDPYTILEGALKTFAALPNASMIVVKREFQHFVLLPYGDDSVDRPIAEYLLYGTQPPRLTTCEGKPLEFRL